MSNNKTTLIQLVSEQTMQNILPALAIRPQRLIHLVTPRVMARSGWIFESLRQAGMSPEREVIQLSPMPGIPESAQTVFRCITEQRGTGNEPVVNFTGGTKLMSIGAYAAAMQEKVCSLYVDTDDRVFVDGHTGGNLASILGNDLSFTAYQAKLTVNMIVVANGCERVTAGLDYAALLPLAEYLIRNSTDEQAVWESIDGRSGLVPEGREPRDLEGWKAISQKPVNLPDPVRKLALKAGLLVERTGQVYLGEPPLNRNDMERLKTRRALLAGGWWEVAIANAVRASGRFRDVRWSANAGGRDFAGSMEEDVLAVDGVRIAYFSCKRGGARGKLSRQLEEMSASARRLGGNFVSKYFCVYLPPEGAVRRNLEKRATQLGIKLVTRETISTPGAFDL